MNEQRLPKGWDQAHIQKILDHYENQTEDEQHAEIEAAIASQNSTMVAVPNELVNEVRSLIAKRYHADHAAGCSTTPTSTS